jgi:hypothetical protein
MPESYFAKFGRNDIISHWWYDEAKEQALQDAMDDDTSLPVGEVEVRYWEESVQ